MTYTKPDLSFLGDAARVIGLLGKPSGIDLEVATGQYFFDPAYDLDE